MEEKIFCSTFVQMSRYGLLLVRCVDLYDGLYGGGLSETWKHVVASRWGKDECKYGTRRNSTCEITCRNLEYLLDFTKYSAYVERKRSRISNLRSKGEFEMLCIRTYEYNCNRYKIVIAILCENDGRWFLCNQ